MTRFNGHWSRYQGGQKVAAIQIWSMHTATANLVINKRWSQMRGIAHGKDYSITV